MQIEELVVRFDKEDIKSLDWDNILNSVHKKLTKSNIDYSGYLLELLYKDECRMVSSKDSLIGRYDEDIETNRTIQLELKKIINERD
jgi:hypothetical protein